ncbi:hypothetical protein [Schleiferilactobacillus harbinensis]|nr:hypothetical protein [Schleiferilactobacillus harbinensis]
MQEIRHFLIGNFLHFTAGVNNMVALQDYLPWAPKVQAFCHE